MTLTPRSALAPAIAGLLLAGCALPPADINLAPLFASESLGSHGHRSELAGGVISFGVLDGRRHLALRPLTWWEWNEERCEADLLFPFGHYNADAEESRLLLVPLGWSTSRLNEEGERDRDWALLPFLFGGSARGESYFALFPLFGTLRDFFTYDEISFVLFPLWSTSAKGERRGWNLLWPLIGGASGGGHQAFRILPLYASSQIEGKKEGHAILWPLISWGRSDLHLEQPRESVMVLPFYGHERQGSFSATSLLWPFFGWSSNDEGYSAFQIWPLVRIVRGGDGAGRPFERTSILPFYAHYRSREIESRSFLWPIIWFRDEYFPDPAHPLSQRSSVMVLPFLQSLRSTSPEGSQRYLQIWPLFHSERRADGGASAQALSLMPYRPLQEEWNRNLQPFVTLYRSEHLAPDLWTARGPLGILRAVETDREWRFSLPLLGGYRATITGLQEFSFLAGLVRLRTDGGLHLLAPAFPGPGFEPIQGEGEGL